MANRSDAPKIQVSFHLLMFAHLGGCLWCEGEGLPLCVLVPKSLTEKSQLWGVCAPPVFNQMTWDQVSFMANSYQPFNPDQNLFYFMGPSVYSLGDCFKLPHHFWSLLGLFSQNWHHLRTAPYRFVVPLFEWRKLKQWCVWSNAH